MYAETFSAHPELLFVLKTQVVRPRTLSTVLRLLNAQLYDVFKPCLAFSDSIRLPFPSGDSPIDFLADPKRAGQLYSDPQDISETLVLLWIRRTKEIILGMGHLWLNP
jgi:hypothetical protein